MSLKHPSLSSKFGSGNEQNKEGQERTLARHTWPLSTYSLRSLQQPESMGSEMNGPQDIAPSSGPIMHTNERGEEEIVTMSILADPQSFLDEVSASGDIADLTKTTAAPQSMDPSDHNNPLAIQGRRNALFIQFRHLGQILTLTRRNSIDMTPHNHPSPDKLFNLVDLADSLRTRSECRGGLKDLGAGSVSSYSSAIDLIRHDHHPDKLHYLVESARSFRTHFERLGRLKDLDSLVSSYRNAVDLILHDHPDKPFYLVDLADSFRTRFECLGELKDLDSSVSSYSNVVDLIRHGHPDRSRYLSTLGSLLFTRFERLGNPSDLHDAISRHRDAVVQTHHHHPHRPARLNALSASLRTHSEHLEQINVIEAAISALAIVIDLTPEDHPDKLAHLRNIGNCLLIRFERLGQLGDLHAAISRYRDAVDLAGTTPHANVHKPACLNNLGISLRKRFEHLEQLSNLEDATARYELAVHLTPNGYPDKPAHVHCIGTSSGLRLGRLHDLEDAISVFRDAVNLTPHDHPNKPTYLTNLATCFRLRFTLLGQVNDLEQAIARHWDAAQLCVDGRKCKHGMSLARFGHHGPPLSWDLERAISMQREAIRLAADSHPSKSCYYQGLADCLLIRFEHVGELSDLEEADSMLKMAVQAKK